MPSVASKANEVSALSPLTKQLVTLVAAPTTVRAMLDGRLNAKLGEYCGLVHGALREPIDNDIKYPVGHGLDNPTAVFRGLKRPFLDHNLDKGVHIYITNPGVAFDYPADRQFSGAGPRQQPVPHNAVFATYVDFSLRAIDELKASADYRGPANAAGVVLYWAWTRASVLDPHLPHEYRTRYEQQVHP